MDEFFCCGQISVLHLYHIVQFVRKLIPAKLALSSYSTMIYHNVSISPSFTVSVSFLVCYPAYEHFLCLA